MPSRKNPVSPAKATPADRRRQGSEQRRQAILDAALLLFAANGFAATRLDDVADRANVAKGTIYLFFKDKEDLFEQIVIGAVMPVFAAVEGFARRSDIPLAEQLRQLFAIVRTDVLGTRRAEIIRLVVNEGARFPRIAEFYHREVISKGMGLIRKMAAAAHARGELASDEVVRFPQLVFAPVLVAVVWDGLFSSIDPLDVEGMLAAHVDVLLGAADTARIRS